MVTARIRAIVVSLGLVFCGLLVPNTSDAQCMGCLDDLAACSHLYHYDYPSGSAYEGSILEGECHWQADNCDAAHSLCFALRGLKLDEAVRVVQSRDNRKLESLLFSDRRYLVSMKARAVIVRGCDGRLAARFPLTRSQFMAASRTALARERGSRSVPEQSGGR